MAARRPRASSAHDGDPPSQALDAAPFPPFAVLPGAVAVCAPVRDDGGVLVDLECRFVNAVALRMSGLRREELVGHRLSEAFPMLAGSSVWAEIAALVDSAQDAEVDLSSPDGVEASLALSAARFDGGVILMARGLPGGLAAVERLDNEAAVDHAVVDLAETMIMVIDPDGRVVRFNRRCEVVSGYREAEVVGRHYELLVPATERLPVAASLNRVWAGDRVGQVNHWVTSAGERRLIEWSAAALAGDPRGPDRVVVTATDITTLQPATREPADGAAASDAATRELERLNAELARSNAELARSNAELEQFALVASHDLREPLRAISLPIQLVAQRYANRLDDKAAEFLGYAVDGCQRMEDRLGALLALARLGGVEQPIRAIDSGQVARQAIATLKPTLDDARAVVVTVEPLPVVLAPRDQLAEVFENLIGNAVKFVAPGVTPLVTISAQRVDDAWRFDVTDNGIGVPPGSRERVFGMFKRLHPAESFSGTGVGLAMVKKIVERHGGEVGIAEAPTGSGSRFWFTLPAARPPGSGAGAAPVASGYTDHDVREEK